MLGRAQYDQIQGNWALDRAPRQTARMPGGPEGSLVGRIEIPRLDLSAVVFEGTSDDTLARGVGHLTGSANPLVLAGHRDTFFRQLRRIRASDQVIVAAYGQEFEYEVESTAIVQPNQTEVLKPSDGTSLILITCYPFTFIGNAPERFVIRAKRVDRIALRVF